MATDPDEVHEDRDRDGDLALETAVFLHVALLAILLAREEAVDYAVHPRA